MRYSQHSCIACDGLFAAKAAPTGIAQISQAVEYLWEAAEQDQQAEKDGGWSWR
jgi:hypothetical protein